MWVSNPLLPQVDFNLGTQGAICYKNNQTEQPIMKKHSRKLHRSTLSLGDLILAVSSCSRNSREAAAAVADLLETGQVRIVSHGTRARG